jgi:hypothetical protein
MADGDDYGEPEPPPRWLADLLDWAADLRTWGVTGLLVWLAAIGVLGVMVTFGWIVRAVG